MVIDTILKLRSLFIRSLIPLILCPLLTFNFVVTFFGKEIGLFIENNPEEYKLYQLVNLEKVIRQVMSIPLHVKNLVVDMVIFSFIIFVSWVSLFTFNSYYKLSRKEHNGIIIAFEYLILLITFLLIVNPGLPVAFSICGYLLFFSLFFLFTIYFLYYRKYKNEKK